MNKIIYQKSLLYPKLLWERPVHFYKAKAGKVLVLAGSKGMSGAAILTSEAVFRSGTGILLLGFPESLKNIYSEILPEAMTLALPETPSKSLAKKAEDAILDNAKSCDVAVIGPGLSQNAETIHLVWQLIFELSCPFVLDADGLSALAKGIEVMRKTENTKFMNDFFLKIKSRFVITPHPGEAARIINAMSLEDVPKNIKAEYIEKNKSEIAEILSRNLNCVAVVKGYETAISDSSKIIIDKVGGPELATAGSGDVLSGIIGSFIGQNPKKIFEATAVAVYLHSLAGILAKEKFGERSIIASDIIRFLPQAIKKAESEM
jgi:NAD(P)H-hydrate epimerase